MASGWQRTPSRMLARSLLAMWYAETLDTHHTQLRCHWLVGSEQYASSAAAGCMSNGDFEHATHTAQVLEARRLAANVVITHVGVLAAGYMAS